MYRYVGRFILLFIFTMTQLSSGQENRKINPEMLHFIDPARCHLAVEDIHTAKILQLTNGSQLTPERLDNHFVLFRVHGISPEKGRMIFQNHSFQIHYLYREMEKFAWAKAIGIKGKKPNGSPIDLWYTGPDKTLGLTMEKTGDPVNIWVAVEVPEAVEAFDLRYLAKIKEPVRLRK